MDAIKQAGKYKVKGNCLDSLLKEFWYIPSDALQRGIEADIWSLCRFKRPMADIGIGNGKMSNFIFKNVPQIDVGIDSDKNSLKCAKKIKKYIKILHANAEKMPFQDSSFNTVVSNSVFEHIKKDFKAVSEVARVLRKNGLFFATVPSEYLQQWILEYEERKNKVGSLGNLIEFNRRVNHLHYRSVSEWEECFKKNSLKMIFCKYYFPKNVALFWYKLFNAFTYRLGGREIWSIIDNSKLTKFIPKKAMISLFKNIILKNAYEKGFFVKQGVGAQLFIIAQKI